MASLSSESDFVNFEEIEAWRFRSLVSLVRTAVFLRSDEWGSDLNSRTIIGSDEFTELRGGSSQDCQVVNNHGDRKSPIPGVVVPLPNGLKNGL